MCLVRVIDESGLVSQGLPGVGVRCCEPQVLWNGLV